MHCLIYVKVHRLLDSDTFICNFASVHNTGDLKSNSQYVVEVLTFSFISKGLTKVAHKLFETVWWSNEVDSLFISWLIGQIKDLELISNDAIAFDSFSFKFSIWGPKKGQ